MKAVINIDGASRGNPGPGAAAVVIKSGSGELLAEIGQCLGECTNNYAEMYALDLALARAAELGASELEIFSDSNLIVNQFNGKYRIKNEHLAELMRGIRIRARAFSRITLSHVPREKNKQADALANKALDGAPQQARRPHGHEGESAGGEQLTLF